MIDKSVKKNKMEESIDDFSICRDCKHSDDSFVKDGKLVENPQLVCEFADNFRIYFGCDERCEGFMPYGFNDTEEKEELLAELTHHHYGFCPFTKEKCSVYCALFNDDIEKCSFAAILERMI